MEMAKYLVCVLTVAVWLGGATANLLLCLVNEIQIITPDNFILKPADAACQDIEVKFHRATPNLKLCLGFDIDISNLESLYHEYCSPNSEFRQKVERQRNCLLSSIGEYTNCASIGMKYKNLIQEDFFARSINDLLRGNNLEKSINAICQSSTAEMVNCLRERVGGPCGEEGLEVYGRMIEASEPLFKGSCLSAANFGLDRPVYFNDFEKAVEPSTAESNTYADTESTVSLDDFGVEWSMTKTEPSMAVTVHSLTYYMLIGLIFVVICW